MSSNQQPGYREYLGSPLWHAIRRRILKRDHHRCFRCGDFGREVHHRNYWKKTLDGKDDTALVTLCDDCHEYISIGPDGERRTPQETERLLQQRCWELRSKPHPAAIARTPTVPFRYRFVFCGLCRKRAPCVHHPTA